jgi:hypothetical protein
VRLRINPEEIDAKIDAEIDTKIEEIEESEGFLKFQSAKQHKPTTAKTTDLAKSDEVTRTLKEMMKRVIFGIFGKKGFKELSKHQSSMRNQPNSFFPKIEIVKLKAGV